MEISYRLITAIAIFWLAVLSSWMSNVLYYAMYDHKPVLAGWLDAMSTWMGWGVNIYILGDLFTVWSWWTVLYVFADGAGEGWRTYEDCGSHGRAKGKLPPRDRMGRWLPKRLLWSIWRKKREVME